MVKLINPVIYKVNEKEMYYNIWKSENKSDEVINKLLALLEKNSRSFYNLEIKCQEYEGGGIKVETFINGKLIKDTDLSLDVREYPHMMYEDYVGFKSVEKHKGFNKGIYKIVS